MLPDSFVFGSQRFFPKETDVTVGRWCTATGVTIDDLAKRLGLSRMALTLVLKGIDPVSPGLERKLREIMAPLSGQNIA